MFKSKIAIIGEKSIIISPINLLWSLLMGSKIGLLIESKILYILISLALGIYENTTSARIVILSTFTSMLRKLRITPI